jgi:hypothetical protein
MKKFGLNQSQQTCFYLFKIILFIFLSLIIYKKKQLLNYHPK